MLVLSRKKDEQIILKVPGHNDIEITIVRFEGQKVRIGITADQDVSIIRSELLSPFKVAEVAH